MKSTNNDKFYSSNTPVFASLFENHLLDREKHFRNMVSNYICCGMSNEELEEELENLISLSLLRQISISSFSEQVLLEEFCESEKVVFRHEIYDKDDVISYYPDHKTDTWGMPTAEVHFSKQNKYLAFLISHEGFCSQRVFDKYQEAITIAFKLITTLNSQVLNYNENIRNFIEDEKIRYKKGLKDAGPFIKEINEKLKGIKKW